MLIIALSTIYLITVIAAYLIGKKDGELLSGDQTL